MKILDTFNRIITSVFNFVLYPISDVNPLWPLLLISGLTGVLMLWIFGKTSNQNAIQKIKDKIRGNLLGVRLYQHDVKVVLALQGGILRDTLVYLKHSLIPIMVLMLPVILILAQLNLRFSAQPIRTGQPALFKVKLNKDAIKQSHIFLETPPEIEVETQPVRIESEGEVAWRIRAKQTGTYTLVVYSNGRRFEKQLRVGEARGSVSTVRTGKILDFLLYPGEPILSDSAPVQSIEVKYPALNLSLFGMQMHWLVIFFIFSFISAMMLKRPMKVQF